MAAPLFIFRIYHHTCTNTYFLLRTIQPAYSNASQVEENKAIEAESHSRNALLNTILEEKGDSSRREELQLIGEMQGFPPGDILYEKQGCKALSVYYCDTSFGLPWILLGVASSETEFLNELKSDDDFTPFFPLGKVKNITADFYVQPA